MPPEKLQHIYCTFAKSLFLNTCLTDFGHVITMFNIHLVCTLRELCMSSFSMQASDDDRWKIGALSWLCRKPVDSYISQPAYHTAERWCWIFFSASSFRRSLLGMSRLMDSLSWVMWCHYPSLYTTEPMLPHYQHVLTCCPLYSTIGHEWQVRK